ncbi:MAG TPA: hypothetical protein VNF29_09805, partial [Candidatus Binataceae bacterium]|nr:hypothetical protein [Candidatus Binataceae bacterium]
RAPRERRPPAHVGFRSRPMVASHLFICVICGLSSHASRKSDTRTHRSDQQSVELIGREVLPQREQVLRAVVAGQRRGQFAPRGADSVVAMEFLIDKMQGAKTNDEFLESMNA